jgi:hypothetical protein
MGRQRLHPRSTLLACVIAVAAGSPASSQWSREAVDTLDVSWESHVSLAFDRTGRPVVAYLGDTGLKLAHRNATDWVLETVDDSGGEGSSLAFDATIGTAGAPSRSPSTPPATRRSATKAMMSRSGSRTRQALSGASRAWARARIAR